MTGIKTCLITVGIGFLFFCETGFGIEHSAQFSSRFRVSDLQNNDTSGKGASGLFRFSLDSSWTQSFNTFAQLDHVETVYDNQHSDGVRFNGQPELTDVASTEVNQLFAGLIIDGWDLRLGRQTIAFDNQRFVGSVSFWQNEQTFDSFFVERHILSASKVHYAYIGNANRIFGDDANERLLVNDVNFMPLNGVRPLASLGDHEHNSHLLRAEFNEWDYSKLITYAYFIDNKDAPLTSSDSIGIRYRFKIKPNTFQYRVDLESAVQKRTELVAKPTLSYLMADAGIALGSVELSARWEQMGSNGNVAFSTPLGTLHEFHGWADLFNNPPREGLNDFSMKLKWRITPFQFDIRVHRFDAEEGSETFGHELDFDIIYKPLAKHALLLRFADFTASDHADAFIDKRRIFFQYAYNL